MERVIKLLKNAMMAQKLKISRSRRIIKIYGLNDRTKEFINERLESQKFCKELKDAIKILNVETTPGAKGDVCQYSGQSCPFIKTTRCYLCEYKTREQTSLG